jgi:hypothetical protein
LLTGKNKEYVLPGWTGWEYNILRRRASGEQHSPALRWQKIITASILPSLNLS